MIQLNSAMSGKEFPIRGYFETPGLLLELMLLNKPHKWIAKIQVIN